MKIILTDLRRQYISLKSDIDRVMQSICQKSAYVLGEELEQFEKEFASYSDSKYAVGVASGFDAIFLILKALGIKKGDEVITPSHTFTGGVLPIIHADATPVFVDVNKDANTLDIEKVKDMISKKTRVILPVHLYGYPAKINELKKIIKGRNIYVIEDAAQAHGSLYFGRKCGSLADAAAFSFYPGKNLGAYGDGGAVVTNNKELAEKIRILRNVGQKEKYKHVLPGFNSRLDNLQAGILRVKLKRLNKWNTRRRSIAKRYTSLLEHVVKTPKEEENFYTNYHIYCIETDRRDQLMSYLRKKNIFCGIHYPIPVHLQKCVKNSYHKKGDLSITEEKAKRIVSLPIFPELTDEEITYISQNIKDFLTN